MQVPRYASRPAAPKRVIIEARHLIVLACFLATLSAYVERVGFSIAYTAMAKVDKVDEATKGTVLSAFYWGYGLSQVGLLLCLTISLRNHSADVAALHFVHPSSNHITA